MFSRMFSRIGRFFRWLLSLWPWTRRVHHGTQGTPSIYVVSTIAGFPSANPGDLCLVQSENRLWVKNRGSGWDMVR